MADQLEVLFARMEARLDVRLDDLFRGYRDHEKRLRKLEQSGTPAHVAGVWRTVGQAAVTITGWLFAAVTLVLGGIHG